MPNEDVALNAEMNDVMALNAEMNDVMALNAKLKMWWLWMSKWECCSKCWTDDELWLWTPNGKRTTASNSKWKMNDGFECRNENVALNAKRKMNNGSECQNKNVSRNAKQKDNAITLNFDPNHGFECRTKIVAMNTEMQKWLWTPNRR